VDTQASYAIPLNFDLFYPEHKELAAQHLAATVQRSNTDDSGVVRPAYSLMTGFIGTASINPALTASGNVKDAYRLLLQREYPSWLYPVVNGATTIWERLNSYTLEDGFGGNNSMNSFNHYSFGAVGAWMNRTVLGIQRDPESPGFKHFFLTPTPDPNQEMTFAKGHYDSPYGRISSAWEQQETETIYEFMIPANTSATVWLQASEVSKISESKKKLKKAEGVTVLGYEDGRVKLEVTSGNYRFRVIR
jgi:alpha-L-rhamnosidase